MVFRISSLVLLSILTLNSQPPSGITPRWPIIQSYAVETLPAAGVKNRIAFVTNANAITSCTAGGGAIVLLCRDTGTVWEPAAGGSAAAGTTYTGSAVIDAINTPDGTCVLDTTAVTVTGAALGGRSTVGSSVAWPEGIKIEAKVIGPNSVKLEICNHSGAAYNPAASTYYFGVTP